MSIRARIAVVALIGCLVSGVLAYGIIGIPWQRPASADDELSFLERLRRNLFFEQQAEDKPLSVAEKFAAYRSFAAIDDIAVLDMALARTVEAPPGAARDFEIGALAGRLAELDPARLEAFARSQTLDERHVIGIVRLLAAVDIERALSVVAGLSDRNARHAAALGLLRAVGNDATGFDRVASALPAAERAAFAAEWLALRAGDDPVGSLREALDMRAADVQQTAVMRIAEVWARQDPAGALRQTVSLPETLRLEYRRIVVEEWARLDLAGLLQYLENAPNPRGLADAIPAWSAAYPEGIFEVAARASEAIDDRLLATSITVLTDRDPGNALAMIETMAPGQRREQLLAQFASVYAEKDSEAALAWLDSMSPSPANLQISVFATIVSANPDRALELLERLGPNTPVADSVLSIAVSRAAGDPALSARLAEGLLARNDLVDRSVLSMIVSNWALEESDTALAWIEESSGRLDQASLAAIIENLVANDPGAAADYVDRAPPEVRNSWIDHVAQPFARREPSAALRWIGQYQGQQGFDSVFRLVITESAEQEPELAAQLLTQQSRDLQLSVAPAVATAWAREDARAAAQWSLGLSDAQARRAAIDRAVSYWASYDAAAAESWADASIPDPALRQDVQGMIAAVDGSP